MKSNERLLLYGAIVLAIAIMELFIYGGIGISVPIYMIIYYSFLFIYCRQQKNEIKIKDNLLVIPIILTSLCFILFDNTLLKFLNIVFLWSLSILNTCDILQVSVYQKYSLSWFLNMIELGMFGPLQNIYECTQIIKSEIIEVFKGKLKNFSKIIIGACIGLISLCVIIPLLMMSDAAFTGVINIIFNNLDLNLILKIFRRVGTFMLVFLPAYSFIYGITKKNEEDIKEKKGKQVKSFDFTIVTTFMSIICLIYLLFYISQFSYFINAFAGILPEDYTFSEYARKGFFECIPLASINLIFVLILNKLNKTLDKVSKSITTKFFAVYIVLFTLFLVMSALAKMFLYINAYGLTLLRVYVAWFLILLILILFCVCIKVLYKKFDILKNVFFVFMIMYLGLNYANVDSLVGRYNVDLYLNKGLNTISTFKVLSLSGAEPFEQIKDLDTDEINDINVFYKHNIRRNDSWQEWNLSMYKAKKIYNK